MYHNIEFTKETSVCEKCIEENNNCESYARGAVEMYCPGYAIWNLNGKSVLGPKTGKNVCPFDTQCDENIG